MLYTTIVQRDETGLNQILDKAREFEESNALEAIISCHFNLQEVDQVLCLVREYQNRLNRESSELVAFSTRFIEEYATDNNQCFDIALRLVRKIGTTITGSMKLFRQFCPVVRRKLEGRNVVPVLDYTRLTRRLYVSEFFGIEPYAESVKTLLHEMSAFFHHLVTTMAVCKDMIRREREVRGDFEQLKRIYDKSCNDLMKSVNVVLDTFGPVKLVSEEEIEERRKNARPLREWLARDYHAHDKKWLRKEAYIRRIIAGDEHGLDPVASQLWSHDHKKGKEVIDAIARLDSLGLGYKNTKTEGKKGKFDAREMVYLIKWSGVSWPDAEGNIVNETKEKQFYLYIQEKGYKGDYEFPSWQAVCRERAFCYKEHMSHEEMANAFAMHLTQADCQEATAAVMPISPKKTAGMF